MRRVLWNLDCAKKDSILSLKYGSRLQLWSNHHLVQTITMYEVRNVNTTYETKRVLDLIDFPNLERHE